MLRWRELLEKAQDGTLTMEWGGEYDRLISKEGCLWETNLPISKNLQFISACFLMNQDQEECLRYMFV